jgi:squalene-hopene/tetraprenyl-beta-curcumene cyclase
MRSAAEFVRDAGGVERTRVFTRMWLSLLSLWSWEDVPVLPPEQIFLPPRAPLSIYSFGCWARQTLVALSIASALRPRTPVPFGIEELRTGGEDPMPIEPWARLFTFVDRGLHRYERKPAAAVRRRGPARRRAMGRRTPGGGRLVGRDPATVGLVDRRSARARLSARPPRDRASARRSRRLHDRG